MSDDLLLSPAHRLAQAVRSKEVSSVELLDGFVDRIEQINPAINAVVTLDLERAREACAAADEAAARGEWRGPLHGLPVTVKDAIETAGIRSTGGAIELTDHVPAADAPVVAKIKDAGAVVFGKTNLPRWSGDFQTFNEIFGTTNNPWDVSRVPGGSSGGAAAAVATGLTSFEIGTDIAGSVRGPAHFCGVFGLKPTFGVIPQRGYLDRVGGGVNDVDINVFGPIARDAADLDLLLDVLAGPPPEDEMAWRLELPPPRRAGLSDFRIGVWLDDPACRTGSAVLWVLRSAVDRLADAGAKIEEAHPAVSMAEQNGLFMSLLTAAVSPSFGSDLGPVLGGSHYDWLHRADDRARTRAPWRAWFEEFDLLLCPVMPIEAFPHTQDGNMMERTLTVDGVERPYLECISWVSLVGFTEQPATSVPVGRTEAGLPVGLQIVAGRHRDREAIHAARLVEEILGGFVPPPMAV
ncbi:MAG TPA: amidase family protein [Acidimicrobiia bacterium]|nr:amidase family protein [Acidimicrobiia bacterium]